MLTLLRKYIAFLSQAEVQKYPVFYVSISTKVFAWSTSTKYSSQSTSTNTKYASQSTSIILLLAVLVLVLALNVISLIELFNKNKSLQVLWISWKFQKSPLWTSLKWAVCPSLRCILMSFYRTLLILNETKEIKW